MKKPFFNITTYQLLLIKIIYESQSLQKASKIIGISQSSLSFQIRKLEKELGIKVFERKLPITLTEEGLIFYNYTLKMLFLCEQLHFYFKDFKDL
jgi:DNA-binding transcriptional LysR family regulator